MQKVKVCVIVLSFNGLETTKQFVELYNNNTNKELAKLIWIDNGSFDGTVEFLKNNNIKLIESDHNLGVAKGRNLGIEYCLENYDFEYIMFLDNDQFVGKNWIQQYLYFTEKNKYDLVGVQAWNLNSQFMPVKRVTDKYEQYSYVGGGGSIFSKKVIQKIGVLDEEYEKVFFQDTDYCLRAYYSGLKIGCNFDNRIVHMQHKTTGMNPAKRQMFQKSYKRFFNKFKYKNVPKIKNV